MGSLLDDSVTWNEFGKNHLDRRITKALTHTLGLERPTLVQSRGIPIALEGKDLLCRARTGSGKTLCYGVPMVQRLLVESNKQNSATPLRGIILVPTKELIAQVRDVIANLLTFCFELLTVEALLSGQKYMKAELPTIMVTTPSSLLGLVKQRAGTMQPLSETLKIMVADEADQLFSFGYEEDLKALCALVPSTYQAMLVSATLSEDVESLKGLMLHKPVILKLEEPRVTGKLTQFYFACKRDDKYLIVYTLLKLKLVQSKVLLFVKDVESGYRLRMLLERFSISSAVLNAELPFQSRQNIIQAFNQSAIEYLIATDEGFRDEVDDVEDEGANAEDDVLKESKKKKRKKTKAAAKNAEDQDGEEVRVEISREKTSFGKKRKAALDEQYSMTRGVDLVGVSTVINVDSPNSVRNYTHRVGRCARAGASGTALTLALEEDLPLLNNVARMQTNSGHDGNIKPLPMQMSDVERFRYRVDDVSSGLTKKAVNEYRARELQMEVLNSEKLQEYFEEHPEEKAALQRAQRQLKEKKSIRRNLQTVPFYLVPEGFTAANPVQQAVRDEVAASGGKISKAARKSRFLDAKRKDPLQAFQALPTVGRKGRKKFTREQFAHIDRRLDPKVTNVESLPPLSGRKLWKLNKGKRLRPKGVVAGDRKRMTPKQKQLKKKFGGR